jgi:RNA polymerase sigma factor (sigma-70 family)
MTSDRQGSLSQEDTQQNERLVRAIADGDRESEREFVQRYARPVRAMLVARSRNPDLAEDLQQDVMIEAICALRRGQLHDPAKLTAFVLAIARNLLNNYFRTSSRTTSLELPDDLPDLNSESDRQEEQEWEPRALKAISSLDAVDRTILQMTLIDGLKPGIIAERLRLKPDVVRQRKLRATRRVIELVHGVSQKGILSHIVAEGAK